jgi:hypothetical protein
MKALLIGLILLTATTNVFAKDWCGQTIPGGTALARHTETLDQDQNCSGRGGIKIPAYATLDLAGHAVIGANNACVRALGANGAAVKNGLIYGCLAEGVAFTDVYNGRIMNVRVVNVYGDGILCERCSLAVLNYSSAEANRGVGIRIAGGATNQLGYVTVTGNSKDGIRVGASSPNVATGVDIYRGYQFNNAGYDVEFADGANGNKARSPGRGRVFFSGGAFNNWASNYVSCEGDGTGHGSNSCR